jgi:hypothetical protein
MNKSNIKLLRLSEQPFGTFGILMYKDFDNAVLSTCLELPYKNNERNISCIPEGFYKCKMSTKPSHKWMYDVLNVPNRTKIGGHIGNVARDTQGCILHGKGFGKPYNIPGITGSMKACIEFIDYMEGHKEFTLEIIKFRY